MLLVAQPEMSKRVSAAALRMVRIADFLIRDERPNAKVNRQKCGAFLSALNLQLGW